MSVVTRSLRRPIVWASALIILAALIALGSVTIVPETRQGVVIRLGRPIGLVNAWRSGQGVEGSDAGLFAHAPFVDRVVLVDRRTLGFELQNQELASADHGRVVVDVYARYRIVNPLTMLKTAGAEGRIADALSPVLASALRAAAARRPAAALYGGSDEGLASDVRAALDASARHFGARVTDVRIERGGPPPGATTDHVIDRMRAFREQQALEIADQGEHDAAEIRAQADADAAKIYADSYGKDPEFYRFYRSMQSYRKTLTTGTAVILSPDSEYLREFKGDR